MSTTPAEDTRAWDRINLMNTTTQPFNTAGTRRGHRAERVRYHAGPASDSHSCHATPAELISGAIGIAGDRINGTVYVHLPESLAHEVTRAMLQCPPDLKVEEREVNDVVGELGNMVGGALKSLSRDADIFCAIAYAIGDSALRRSKLHPGAGGEVPFCSPRPGVWSWRFILQINW